jgi:hypothetical protein
MRLRVLGVLLVGLLLPLPALAQAPVDSVAVPQAQIQEVRSAMGALDRALGRLDAPAREPRTGLASVLFLVLAVAVVFESAMSAIFDWRIYLRYLQGRGFKTPILVGTALWVCVAYEIDVLNRILAALGRQEQSHAVGTVLTALLVSGGSSAVFRVYARLGIRSPAERRRTAREERADAETDRDEASPSATAPDTPS